MVRSSLLLLALGFGLAAPTAQAQTFDPALAYTSVAKAGSGTMDLTVGSKFTVGSVDQTVYAVGTGNAPFFFTAASQVTVRFYVDGTTTNVATVNIFPTDPTTTDGKYYYSALGVPFTLNANTTYDVVVDVPTNISVGAQATNLTTIPGITYDGAVGAGGLGAFPTSDPFGVGPYFGPTFSVVPVPEPATVLGLAAAGLGLTGWGRRWVRRRNTATG